MDALDLTPEQYGKMKACKTPEEIAELAKTEGIPLTDEQLEAVAGGESDWTTRGQAVCRPDDKGTGGLSS